MPGGCRAGSEGAETGGGSGGRGGQPGGSASGTHGGPGRPAESCGGRRSPVTVAPGLASMSQASCPRLQGGSRRGAGPRRRWWRGQRRPGAWGLSRDPPMKIFLSLGPGLRLSPAHLWTMFSDRKDGLTSRLRGVPRPPSPAAAPMPRPPALSHHLWKGGTRFLDACSAGAAPGGGWAGPHLSRGRLCS